MSWVSQFDVSFVSWQAWRKVVARVAPLIERTEPLCMQAKVDGS